MSDPYKHWLKVIAETCIPQARDWRGVGSDAVDALASVGHALALTGLRLLVLVTFPISVPLLARWCWKRAQLVEWLRKEREQEVIDELTKLNQKEAA
ncbi:hypothetical protein G7048_19250 [Diaphorobacter sp. HDW4B]|uniref:hypothetical protein n=1 Tax=Diaphorobacter sp. HDW4B TaxID=2714925 RepID=UPI001407F612|nr:hypothetical protein [Diaphorobacter sp. HDW4B]QIL72303.1 hypothetical protein G7048_19250 [Diaphorobacter sp. HDW4B]